MSLLPELDEFRSAFGGLDGADLIRALAGPGGPLRHRTALVSAFGAESVVLLHMAAEVDPGLPVIFLDTGKHFPETLAYRDQLVRRLGLTDIRTAYPDKAALVRHDRHGRLFEDDPDLCCHIRKTEPLSEELDGFAAWITGRKRSQGGLRLGTRRLAGGDAGQEAGEPGALLARGAAQDGAEGLALLGREGRALGQIQRQVAAAHMLSP